jgi:hypothetical protein
VSVRRPPALPAPMLERLGYIRQNPALAGDLLEELQERPVAGHTSVVGDAKGGGMK